MVPLRIHKEKTSFQTDIIIQFLLKQGQVEVSLTDLTSSYTDSVLLPRRVVEDLNTTIRVRLSSRMDLYANVQNAVK